MINFLIHRPIAVTMTFIAVLVLGILAIRYIPISLMPDIAIPEITVQVNSRNTPARELENTVVKNLRRGLLQTSGLSDIKSETRDENGTIHLRFQYGTRIDYAFIEVNEKIDRVMGTLPRSVERPKVIKASATDIPVFWLNLTLRHEHGYDDKDISAVSQYPLPLNSSKFAELSGFASQVIRKRLEQLQEVAMADISGLVHPQLLIVPDIQKIGGLNISLAQFEETIKSNHLNLGNLLIRDGQYQYNIRFSSTIRTIRDIEDIYIRSDDRLLQIGDIAEVIEMPQRRKGLVTFNDKDAITLAIIKQGDARMGDLKKNLYGLIEHFKADYPHIEFDISRDQTKLLDYSIGNLRQSLSWGAILAFMVMFFFLKDYRSPLLIGITIPASLIISLLFFYIAGISINIISLSGLILGVGMMVDNSIIVIDNITQYREMGHPLEKACIKGTGEVFRPMLSAVLTTCAVFVPLIFLSGISGALFYDQAMAVAIGLFVSLAVSITVLPVYYRLIYLKKGSDKINIALQKINRINYNKVYKKWFRFTMRNQLSVWIAFIAMIAGTIVLYGSLPKESLPMVTTQETILKLDWNEKITIEENRRRVFQLVSTVHEHIDQHMCLIGQQQFLLERASGTGASEAEVYIMATSPETLATIKESLAQTIATGYPAAVFAFDEADNIFELIFSDDQPPLTARLRTREGLNQAQNPMLEAMATKIGAALPGHLVNQPIWQEHVLLKVDRARLMTYGIRYEAIYDRLKSALNEKEILLISDNQDYIPVVLGGQPMPINQMLSQAYVRNQAGDVYPVRDFISETRGHDLKTIVSGQEGEYFPLHLNIQARHADRYMGQIREVVREDGFFEVDFTGSIFRNKELIKELALIFLISLLLLYFILASQFESLTLPLIILLETPIAVFGAFLFLALAGGTINIMSLIGLVVMCGIMINDSILKIDTINQLRKGGMPILKAMAVAGERRLKPILMTSITTILALTPLFFSSGLGADLQKPLAMAVIGGMSVGTIVSLYFIPLCYYYLKRQVKGGKVDSYVLQ